MEIETAGVDVESEAAEGTVAGMSTEQIEKLIATRLRNGYLRNPQVSAQVTTRPLAAWWKVVPLD